MVHPLDDRARQWIRSEQAGAEGEADQAFRALSRGWPRQAVPAGLVRDVLLAVRRHRRPADPWAAWWVRAAVAVSVLSVGGALTWHSASSLGAAVLSAIQSVASGVDAVIWLAVAWIETVAALGRPVVRLAMVMGASLTAPVPAVVCLLNVLLSACALAVLRRLLAVREV